MRIVNSVEINNKTCEILKNNIQVYGYRTNNVFCQDYLKIYLDLNQDCVFFDPPWGGADYYKIENLDLFLGDKNIIDIIYEIMTKNKAELVVFKAPKNFNFKGLSKTLKDYNIEKIPIFRSEKKKHSYDVYFISKIEEDFGEDGMDAIDVDKSTYQLYYNKDKIEVLIEHIIELFNKYYFRINLNNIINYFPEYTIFEILTSLRIIINQNKIIYNKYGFPSYLKEDKDIYFLVDNLTNESNYFSNYYTKNPIVNDKLSFNDVINDIAVKSSPRIIKNIFRINDVKTIKNILDKLPLEITEIILENCIMANEKNIEINKNKRNIILDILKNYLKKIILENGNIIYISSILYTSKKILKCLEVNNIENGWNICSGSYYDEYLLQIKREKELLKENKYGGYYGLVNKDKFCIKVPDLEEVKKDARKVLKGHMCTTYDRGYITNLMISIFKVPIPEEKIPDNILKNNKKIWENINKFTASEIKYEILKNDYVNKIYTLEDLNKLDPNEIQRIYYWGNQQKNQMCQFLKDFLDKEGLLILDEKCGKSQKGEEEDKDKKKDKKKKRKEEKE